MLTLNNEMKSKASMLKIDISSPRAVFRILLSMSGRNLFVKIVSNFKSINIFTKSFVLDAYVCDNPICSCLS